MTRLKRKFYSFSGVNAFFSFAAPLLIVYLDNKTTYTHWYHTLGYIIFSITYLLGLYWMTMLERDFQELDALRKQVESLRKDAE